MSWHQRLGQINNGSLQHMRHFQIVNDLPQIKPPNGVYEGCMQGDNHQECFPKDLEGEKKIKCIMTNHGGKYINVISEHFSNCRASLSKGLLHNKIK
jgi:hypothetical protein